jgi:hypothetical protein
MKRQIVYEDLAEINGEALGEIGEAALDFLPTPAELAGEEMTVKVTLALSERSVTFFKALAQQRHSSYQRMIRRLLDAYSARQSVGSAGKPLAVREK